MSFKRVEFNQWIQDKHDEYPDLGIIRKTNYVVNEIERIVPNYSALYRFISRSITLEMANKIRGEINSPLFTLYFNKYCIPHIIQSKRINPPKYNNQVFFNLTKKSDVNIKNSDKSIPYYDCYIEFTLALSKFKRNNSEG